MIFAIIKLWLVALVVDASNITTIKHYISTEDFNSLKFAKAPPLLPIDFSPRIRRQQAAGTQYLKISQKISFLPKHLLFIQIDARGFEFDRTLILRLMCCTFFRLTCCTCT